MKISITSSPESAPARFSDLKLSIPVELALKAMGFEIPTPIQSKAIPFALQGRDIVGCAQTGTGKTAAYLIPILERLLTSSGKTALVLVPTRELVQQIEIFWRKLAEFAPDLRCAPLIGGAPMPSQIRALSRKPRLVVATPGRLIDHLERRTVDLSRVDMLVLDEADRMLDMGFAPQLKQVLRSVPTQRQTLLFTATWAPVMDQIAEQHLNDPERVTIGEVSQAAPDVIQTLVSTTGQRKNETLLDELNRRPGSILVFARTQLRTDRVARYLSSYGVAVNSLHGGRTQGQRNSALGAFRSGKIRVLVATDIAARGIDVAQIAHVINYDLPQAPEDYIHRIGRTGRAGATGSAVSLITPEDRASWQEISRHLKKSGSDMPGFSSAQPV